MPNRNTKAKDPTAAIIGDSILKKVYGHIISKTAKLKKYAVVKNFSGAKVNEVKHYLKPTQEKSPSLKILHDGTNNLVINKDSNEIAKEIVQLDKSAKTDKNKVVIPSLVTRKDS